MKIYSNGEIIDYNGPLYDPFPEEIVIKEEPFLEDPEDETDEDSDQDYPYPRNSQNLHGL